MWERLKPARPTCHTYWLPVHSATEKGATAVGRRAEASIGLKKLLHFKIKLFRNRVANIGTDVPQFWSVLHTAACPRAFCPPACLLAQILLIWSFLLDFVLLLWTRRLCACLFIWLWVCTRYFILKKVTVFSMLFLRLASSLLDLLSAACSLRLYLKQSRELHKHCVEWPPSVRRSHNTTQLCQVESRCKRVWRVAKSSEKLATLSCLYQEVLWTNH